MLDVFYCFNIFIFFSFFLFVSTQNVCSNPATGRVRCQRLPGRNVPERKKKKKKWKWQNSKIRLALRILSSSILKFFRSTKNIIFITFNWKLFLKKQLYCHIYHFSIKIYNKQKLKIMSKGKQSTKKSYQNNKQKALKSTKVKEKTNNRRS